MSNALVIWKYTLTPDAATLDIPVNYEILDVQLQHGQPQLWLLVSPSAPTRKVVVQIYGTGQPIHSDEIDTAKYAGTFQQMNGALVWHVFLKDDVQR